MSLETILKWFFVINPAIIKPHPRPSRYAIYSNITYLYKRNTKIFDVIVSCVEMYDIRKICAVHSIHLFDH